MTQYVLTITEWFNFSGVTEFFRNLKRSHEYNKQVRNTIRELSRLSDHELKDIGISRGEIYDIAHESFKEDYNDYVKKINSNLKGWV